MPLSMNNDFIIDNGADNIFLQSYDLLALSRAQRELEIEKCYIFSILWGGWSQTGKRVYLLL